jgi:hypothetical protein
MRHAVLEVLIEAEAEAFDRSAGGVRSSKARSKVAKQSSTTRSTSAALSPKW